MDLQLFCLCTGVRVSGKRIGKKRFGTLTISFDTAGIPGCFSKLYLSPRNSLFMFSLVVYLCSAPLDGQGGKFQTVKTLEDGTFHHVQNKNREL